MANLTGTNVAAAIVPFTTDDNYPSHIDVYGQGGLQSVPTTADRNNISSSRRKEGMFVYCVDNKKLYQLNGGIANENWIEYVSGLTSSEVTAYVSNATSAFITYASTGSFATITFVNDSISGLASKTFVTDSVSAFITSAALTGLASITYVNNSISGLASTTYVNNSISGLASTTYVNNSISGMATTQYVTNATSAFITNNSLTGLASTTYVNNSISAMATQGYVTNATSAFITSNSLTGLASTTYVNNSISAMATTQYVTNALTGASSSGAGGLTAVSVTASTNIVKNTRYVVSASTTGITLTLPLSASSTVGDYIEIVDGKGTFGTYSVTVARNGNFINGSAEDLIIDVSNTFITLTYSSDPNRGWQLDIGGNSALTNKVKTVYSNLVEEKIITVATSAVVFTGLDALIDGDYYLEGSIVGTPGAAATDLELYINGYTVNTDYRQTWGGTQYNQNMLCTVQGDYATVIKYKISLVNGKAFILGETGRQNAATTLTYTPVSIQYMTAITTISSLVLRMIGGVAYIKAGSVFRLYKSQGAKYLVPYEPQNITSRTSDYPLKAGEVVYLTYTAATTVPLNIATVEGEYEIIINNKVEDPTTGSDAYLRPNNITGGATITFTGYMTYNNWNTTTSSNASYYAWHNVAAAGFPMGTGKIRKSNVNVSTFTVSKGILRKTASIYDSSNKLHRHEDLSAVWEDIVTAWTSLGTIVFAEVHTGTIIIKRIL